MLGANAWCSAQLLQYRFQQDLVLLQSQLEIMMGSPGNLSQQFSLTLYEDLGHQFAFFRSQY
jgi:hypothetical protein